MSTNGIVLTARDLSVWYGGFRALRDINLEIRRNTTTALIGPSGCGKSTLLRCFNRMNDLIPEFHIDGGITFAGEDIYAAGVDATDVRYRMGMVFQKPNPFPKSIYDNVAFGPRVNGLRGNLDGVVEDSLRRAALWDEVKDRLNRNALALSGGQQQRLCIARALAVRPEIILMDEPCSALDPIATARVVETIANLKESYTIVLVTHNLQQAARVSDYTAFFYMGKLVEMDLTERIFTTPRLSQTEDYVTGRFG
ncbi:MAG: phosphate ABC transporter ATP-binding protein [Dehalococcoidia bacterium]|nr:phosphate ABC transporter ATP-binding protein [Dehalococcoidia bacterium]